MSGQKIDLSEIADQHAYSKPGLTVVEDSTTEPNPTPPSIEPIPPEEKTNGGSSTLVIKEESIKEVINKSDRVPTGERAVIVDGVSRRDSQRSSQKKPQSSTRLPPPGSSSRRIADAIGDAIRNSQRSDREPSTKKSRLPAGEGRKPKTPPLSERLKKILDEDEEKPNEDEIDMMPRTPAEKHNYWKTRLQILKTSYSDVSIPRNADELDWAELRKIYFVELDRVSLSKNVDTYKMIMIVLFFIVEGIASRLFKVDITGFTVHSLRSMKRYERLLIELGEKNYSNFGENWPVEFRLGGMVLVSAIIFVLAKYIFKLTGQDMSDEFFDLFNNLGTQTVEADLGKGAGMDAPSPGNKGNDGGGLMGILGGLLGGGGGLGGLGALFGGGGKQPPKDHPKGNHGDADGERIKPPSYAPRRKPKRAASEGDVVA